MSINSYNEHALHLTSTTTTIATTNANLSQMTPTSWYSYTTAWHTGMRQGRHLHSPIRRRRKSQRYHHSGKHFANSNIVTAVIATITIDIPKSELRWVSGPSKGSHADKEISPGCTIEVSEPFGSVWCVLGGPSFEGLVIIG